MVEITDTKCGALLVPNKNNGIFFTDMRVWTLHEPDIQDEVNEQVFAQIMGWA
jgi:hypothetical protein